MITSHPVLVVVATTAPSTAADTFLWAVQWTLAVALVLGNTLAAAAILTGRLDRRRIPATAALSGRTLALLGATHVAGGLGLVLPQVTGVLPWLTPTAGLALAVQALMASGFHLRAHEEALEPALWGALFGVVALGRVDLLADVDPLPPPVLVALLATLLVALAVNLAVLLRGPRNPFRAAA